MKTILLTGKNGQVGWELCRTLAPLGRVVALDAAELDLARPAAIRDAVRSIRPDIIVNPAAYTAVDKAEAEKDLVQAVNGDAPGVLAEEAKALGAWMVHYSTDYVFDGEKQGAYVEDDAPNPQSVYGRTKLAGEEAIRAAGGRHLIFRTSWVYGSRGHNFLLTMLRLARERKELKVVDDQIGAPTWCRSLAEMTAQILSQMHRPGVDAGEVSGVYHMTSSGSVSWHGFAAEILAASGIDPLPALLPIPSSGYPTPAQRPKNSVLSNEKLARVFGLGAGDWKDNLRLCMEGVPRG
ncbi:MAG TPA: dTDP-4-dehydrorhamnose reductase [Gallionellaceae bacterium]|nr:dTDP-4-dehydrorhamnose reductase [Gallionellaceae bacterium]